MTIEHLAEKSQRRAFASQALPDLFHAAPGQFLFFLERDGVKVLHFYWNESAKKLGLTDLEPAYGLSWEILRPNPRATVALISLPQPQNPGETYFEALCYRPYRVMPFGWLNDTTKVLSLERANLEGDPEATLLVEWTKRHGREEIGTGPQPDLDRFYQAVLEQIKD